MRKSGEHIPARTTLKLKSIAGVDLGCITIFLQVTGSSMAPQPAATSGSLSCPVECGGAPHPLSPQEVSGDATMSPLSATTSGSLATAAVSVASVHGKVLLLPLSCPQEYRTLVRDCLLADPVARPIAAEVKQRLQRLMVADGLEVAAL